MNDHNLCQRSGRACGPGLLLVMCAGGCVAGGARLRVGPVVDTEGHAAVQADVAFGFGYATTDHSGVMLHAHGGGGSGDRLAFGESVEYVRFSDEGYGWRSGISFDIAPIDDRFRGWIQGAITYPLRRSRSSGGHEKMWSETKESRWSLGLEAKGGLVEDLSGPEDPDQRDAAPAAFGLAATLEWTLFSRVH